MRPVSKGIYMNVIASSAIVSLVFLLLFLISFNGNISGFYRIGSLKISPLLDQHDLIVHKGPHGHDGQQFLTLALDPLLLQPQTKDALDNPSYRAKRIMFPFLGYVSGAGSPRLILYSLAIINFLCLILLVVFASLWFFQNSKPTNWALIILAIPSAWIIVSLSTSEIFCATFSLAALYYFKKNHDLLTVMFVTLAVFTRETAILLVISLFFLAIHGKKNRFAVSLSIPVVLYGLWNLYLNARVLNSSSFKVSEHISIPLQGILNKFSYFLQADKTDISFYYDLGAFLLLLLVVITGITCAIKNFKIFPELSLLFLLQVTLFFMFKASILNKFGDYTRVCMEIYLYSFLMIPFGSKTIKIIVPVAAFILSVGYIIGFLIQSSLALNN